MNDVPKVVEQRLVELGCEKLPPSVRARLVENLAAEVEAFTKKRAAKLNATHVGRAFRAAFLPKKAGAGSAPVVV
jgi:glycyl-tRNA synthetase beta subunit